MREFKRTDRLASELQRELAGIFREEARDPRVSLVTIQEVRVSRDLSHAKVFFTCMDGDKKAVEKLLNKTLAGFLRRALAHRVRMRSVPQLHFTYDESIERGRQLSDLIEQAVGQSSPVDNDS